VILCRCDLCPWSVIAPSAWLAEAVTDAHLQDAHPVIWQRHEAALYDALWELTEDDRKLLKRLAIAAEG
jgi:hypothetical protein